LREKEELIAQTRRGNSGKAVPETHDVISTDGRVSRKKNLKTINGGKGFTGLEKLIYG